MKAPKNPGRVEFVLCKAKKHCYWTTFFEGQLKHYRTVEEAKDALCRLLENLRDGKFSLVEVNLDAGMEDRRSIESGWSMIPVLKRKRVRRKTIIYNCDVKEEI